MTTYGTIPTEIGASNAGPLARAREQIQSGLGMRRPWMEMVQFETFNLPTSFTEAFQRIRTNTAFFRVNYTIIILFALFLGLFWYPVSLVIFIVMMAAWLFLYFLRDEPLTIFDVVIDDGIVMSVLLVLTVLLLLLTNVTNSIIIGLSVGVAIAVVHGALRSTEDTFLLEEDEERMGSRGTEAAHLRLKHAASSSFTSS